MTIFVIFTVLQYRLQGGKPYESRNICKIQFG